MKLYYGDPLWDKDINSIFQKNMIVWHYPPLRFTFNKDIPSPAINGDQMETYHQWMDIVVLASIQGLPAISVPVGFSREGLPVGMQLIGKRKSDTNLVAFAKKYEAIFQLLRRHSKTSYIDSCIFKLDKQIQCNVVKCGQRANQI